MLALNKSEKDGAETEENAKPDEKDLSEGTTKSEDLSEETTKSEDLSEETMKSGELSEGHTDSPSKDGHLPTSDMEVNEDT